MYFERYVTSFSRWMSLSLP